MVLNACLCDYSCLAPSTMNNYIDKLLCWYIHVKIMGAQWLSGRGLDSIPRCRGFEPQRSNCVVSLSKNINPSLILVQPRKTRPFITERLLMGRKELDQTNTNVKNIEITCQVF